MFKIVPGVFSPSECLFLRQKIENFLKSSDQDSHGREVNNLDDEELHTFLAERIKSLVPDSFAGKFSYFGIHRGIRMMKYQSIKSFWGTSSPAHIDVTVSARDNENDR